MQQPIPPETSRADALGRLRRERWLAADAHETKRVAELDAQIAQLSAAGTATAPLRETAAAAKPGARTTSKSTPKKGTRRVPVR